MTKIKNQVAYKVKSPLTLSDYAIGTNSESGIPGFALGQSISIELNELRNLFIAGLSPETGGTLKITEIEYSGELTSVSDVANALNPAYQVSQYEVLVFNVNGNKYILKEQNIAIGVGEDNLADSDFINMIAFVKLGDGTAILKGYNESTGNWEFYAIKSTGNDVSVVSNNVVIDPKEGTNLGSSGVAIYKGLNATTKLHEFYKIDSDDFSVTLVGNVVKINNISTTDARTFYVNSGYDIGGSAPETGTLGKPYKTIASAKTAYIGTGDAQDPQFKNSDIIIQKGVGYSYTGNLNLNMGTGTLIIDDASVTCDPDSGDWLCDFDTLSDTEFAGINISLTGNSLITLKKNGFRNRGTSINNSLFTDYKSININLEPSATIYCDVNDAVSTTYTIIESNYVTTDTFKNDSAVTITVSGGTLFSLTQKIDKIGGNSNVRYENCTLKSGTPNTTINTNLIAFDRIGGKINSSNCTYEGASSNTRAKLFSFTKNSAIPCEMYSINDLVIGNTTTLFQNESANQSILRATNMSTLFFTCTNIVKSPNVTWIACGLFYCNFGDGEVDFTQVDLTASNSISSYNIFDNNIVETLRVFGSRVLAVAGGLKKGSKFINRKTITAGNFVVGVEYQILTVGTTDFTLIGASANTVGLNFTATGVGSGNGTAYQHTIDILI
jgi:hypothetical protein